MRQDRLAEWENLERICDLLYVECSSEKPNQRMWVKGEMHRYRVFTGSRVPSFVFYPQHEEIFYRLIMKAALTENVNELNLSQSNC